MMFSSIMRENNEYGETRRRRRGRPKLEKPPVKCKSGGSIEMGPLREREGKCSFRSLVGCSMSPQRKVGQKDNTQGASLGQFQGFIKILDGSCNGQWADTTVDVQPCKKNEL